MDLSFFRRAEARFAGQSGARLDFSMLGAVLRAQQGLSAAARVQTRSKVVPEIGGPLIELVLAGPDWRHAAAAQRGHFSPAYVATRRRKRK